MVPYEIDELAEFLFFFVHGGLVEMNVAPQDRLEYFALILKTTEYQVINLIKHEEDLIFLVPERLKMRGLHHFFARHAADIVNIILPFLHVHDIHFKSCIRICICLGGWEEHEVGYRFPARKVRMYALLQDPAKLLVELDIAVVLVFLHLAQEIEDLLRDILFYNLDLAVVLEDFTRYVQGQVRGIYKTLYKTEIRRDQVLAMFHNLHPFHIEHRAYFVILIKDIERGL